MTRHRFLWPLTIAGLMAFSTYAAATVTPAPIGAVYISSSSPENQTITLTGNKRQMMGRAAVIETPKGALIQLEVRGLLGGWHGLRMTAIGDCSDAETGFQNAGPSLARPGEAPGFLNSTGPLEGDLPNIWVGLDGTSRAQFFTPFLNPIDLHKNTGSALIILAGEDNFKNDPADQARVACGIIVPKQP